MEEIMRRLCEDNRKFQKEMRILYTLIVFCLLGNIAFDIFGNFTPTKNSQTITPPSQVTAPPSKEMEVPQIPELPTSSNASHSGF